MSFEDIIRPRTGGHLDINDNYVFDTDTEVEYYSDPEYSDLDYLDSESESEYGVSAQEQWEESIKQITGLVNYVLFPVIGKLLGRRTAHFVWLRFANWWF